MSGVTVSSVFQICSFYWQDNKPNPSFSNDLKWIIPTDFEAIVKTEKSDEDAKTMIIKMYFGLFRV